MPTSSQSQPTNGNPSNLSITASWEKPLVAATGGDATLMVRIAAAIGEPATASIRNRRAPVDVAFVLDRSGSMQGEKLDLVKEAVDVAIAHLGDEDRAALVIYDNDVETLHHLEPATARVKTAIRLALHGVDVGGSTNLSGGWLTGCGELSHDLPAAGTREQPVRLRRSLLLTDGLANVGILDTGDLTKHASELRRRGISTTTLGVGLDYDEDLLASVAEAGGGNFQFIERPRQLRSFFEKELGELLSVVAAGLNVAVTFPPGVRARLVNLFPVDRQGKRIDVAIGDLPAGDELHLIFNVTVKPGPLGATQLVALEATWSDPAADIQRSFALTLPPLVLTDAETADATPSDPTVAEQAAMQRANLAQREAMRLDRQGRHVESRAQMRFAVQSLSAAPRSAMIHERLAMAEHYARFDDSASYDEATRKRGAYDAHRRSRGKQEDGT